MAARATGSGTIAFGMVSIPIKIYTAASTADAIRFNQLHESCGSRVKQQLYCPKDDEIVPRENVVKGYEFSKGKYVTFSAEELKTIEEVSTKSIDINEFVPLDAVDPVYFEKPYYLGPDKGGARAYSLLAEAMRRTQLCAIAKYASRGKMYVIMLRPVEDGIIMQQLRYHNEVRSFDDVPKEDVEVKEGELNLAMKLIEQVQSKTFNPESYSDEVRERVEALIQRKVEGEEITAEPAESPKAQVIDLMAALKASIAGDAAAADASDEEASDDAKPKRKAPKSKGKKKSSKAAES